MTEPRKTSFTIVARPTRPRRRTRLLAVLLALLAAAGVAAAAGALTVGVREEAAALFAERVNIGDQFEMVDATVTAVAVDAGARGTLAAPDEMTAAMPDVRTPLARDHWAYTVTIRERAAAGVASGTFVVTAFLDGTLLGSAYFTQGTAQAGDVEGVRATFDAGTQLAASSLYYVVVEAVLQTAPTVDVILRSNPNGNQSWLGVGGSIDGTVNPTLRVAPGTILRLTARNADNLLHDIGVRTTSDALIDPPGWSADVDTAGEEATIAWSSTAGNFRYQCRYHPQMRGDIVVA